MSCSLLYERGVVTLTNRSQKNYYYVMTMSDTTLYTMPPYDRKSGNAPLLKSGESVKFDLKTHWLLKPSAPVKLYLFSRKPDARPGDQDEFRLERTEFIGAELLDQTFWRIYIDE